MSKFTKEHYEDVARILQHARNHEPRFGKGVFTAIGQAIVDFADLFAADNPQFDRARFLAACGLEPARPYSTSMFRPSGE